MRDTGEGSSHDALAGWKRVHEEYLELFEVTFERFVSREGGSLAVLMEDCRVALENKHGWLFEDENYAAFVAWMKSVLDFEHFHGVMRKKAKQLVEGRATRK